MNNYLIEVLEKQKSGIPTGAVSACTANGYAIKAAMKRAQFYQLPVIIEATANQVDQNGGYTGMRPSDFVQFVHQMALEVNFPVAQIILGGDHLGPLTRAKLPEADAMMFAEELVRSYVMAGFTKIHIDTSMHLASDPENIPLSDKVIAERGVRLCQVAEAAYQNLLKSAPESRQPVYVIGSEVPIPGGAKEHEDSICVTSPEKCRKTYDTFKNTFIQYGLESVLHRVVALVVQPGVEFGDEDIFKYNHEKAADLVRFGKSDLPIVFEGHSTDYQPRGSLKAMVQDGIAFLKVGPALTFALREALFALELIEKELYIGKSYLASNFRDVLEMSMLNEPGNWVNHYHGDAFKQKLARKYSFSDRARYYLPDPEVEKAIHQLTTNLDSIDNIPLTLISQYLPREYESISQGHIEATAEALILEHIGSYLDDYYFAISA